MHFFLNTGHIAVWLLFAGLFFPRLALFFAALGMGTYPDNDMPTILNFVLWLCVPRLLMAYYICLDMGPNNFWFLAYLGTGLAAYFMNSKFKLGRWFNYRKKVAYRVNFGRKGARTATFDEEEVY